MKTSRSLFLTSLAAILLIAAPVFVNVWNERRQADENARQRLTSLSLALAEQLERSLQSVDLALADVTASLASRRDWGSQDIHGALKTYATALPQIRAFAVANADGYIVNDSALYPSTPIYLGDREYFKRLQGDPRGAMYISLPVRSRRDNAWTVILTRPIRDGRGGFNGLVFARMDPGYFQELYRNVLHLEGSAITVLRRDGFLLFREPHAEEVVGQDLSQVPLFSAMLAKRERGAYEAVGRADSEPRVFAYAALRSYPLVLTAHQTQQAILAEWRATAWRTLAALVVVLVMGIWLTRRLLRALRAQEEAAEALRLSASVFEHTQEGILITDAGRRIVSLNRAFEGLTGYRLDDLRGRTPALFRSGRHDRAFYDQIWRNLERAGQWRGEIWNLRKNGELYPCILNIAAVRDPAGQVTHYVALYADIAQQKNTEAHLEKLANYDMLTGLPNRALLGDRMELAVARARRQEKLLAVCFLDLDGFKTINDRHGHDIGDRLLIEVARRLRTAVRGDDTVARLGGDEFVLLLSELSTVAQCEAALDRLLDGVRTPYRVGDLQLDVSASIGVAVYPFDDVEPDQLLRQADHAMYRAKQKGRNRYHFCEAGDVPAPDGRHD